MSEVMVGKLCSDPVQQSPIIEDTVQLTAIKLHHIVVHIM